eukprot:6253038-Pyramimonas_sp.AAC.1
MPLPLAYLASTKPALGTGQALGFVLAAAGVYIAMLISAFVFGKSEDKAAWRKKRFLARSQISLRKFNTRRTAPAELNGLKRPYVQHALQRTVSHDSGPLPFSFEPPPHMHSTVSALLVHFHAKRPVLRHHTDHSIPHTHISLFTLYQVYITPDPRNIPPRNLHTTTASHSTLYTTFSTAHYSLLAGRGMASHRIVIPLLSAVFFFSEFDTHLSSFPRNTDVV